MRRPGLAVLTIGVLAGCGSSGTANNNPGSIALALSPSSESTAPGGQTITTVTLTRSGFTGPANLTFTGAPTGVTATVSNIVFGGTSTTATVTLDVGIGTVAGTYPIVMHGTGNGVTEATATYTLTVTATPEPGS
jgi:hypothetical protein